MPEREQSAKTESGSENRSGRGRGLGAQEKPGDRERKQEVQDGREVTPRDRT